MKWFKKKKDLNSSGIYNIQWTCAILCEITSGEKYSSLKDWMLQHETEATSCTEAVAMWLRPPQAPVEPLLNQLTMQWSGDNKDMVMPCHPKTYKHTAERLRSFWSFCWAVMVNKDQPFGFQHTSFLWHFQLFKAAGASLLKAWSYMLLHKVI